MNHIQNAIEIVEDAPITVTDFSRCYPFLNYGRCSHLLSMLANAGMIRRLKFGLYGAA